MDLNLTVDEILLPFLPYSTAEHWLMATDGEEISLVFSEMIDLYSSIDESERQHFDEEKIHNIVYMILKNMSSEDNTVRLQGLRILRLLVEDYANPLSDICSFFYTVSHDLIQDPSRVIRNAALKLLSTVAAKINFGIVSPSITSLLESTYQYHEYSLRACSIAVLHFISETQVSSIDNRFFTVFLESLLQLAGYAASIILFSSEQITKNSSTRNTDENASDSEESPRNTKSSQKGDSSGLFATYEASIDLMALICVSKSIIEAFTQSSAGYQGVSSVRHGSSAQIIDTLLSEINAGKFSSKITNEIVQRIRSFNFPSLSDEVIHELSEEIIEEIQRRDKTEIANRKKSLTRDGSTSNFLRKESSRIRLEELASKSETPKKNGSHDFDENIITKKHSTSRDLEDVCLPSNRESLESTNQFLTSQELSDYLDPNKLSSLKTTRKSLVKSQSSKKHPEVNEVMSAVDRSAYSAESGFRNSPAMEGSIRKPPTDNYLSLADSAVEPPGEAMTPIPQCHTPNGGNFSRAANARAKRTKLKGALVIETAQSLDEKFHRAASPDMNYISSSQPSIINVNSATSLKALLHHDPSESPKAKESNRDEYDDDNHSVLSSQMASSSTSSHMRSPKRPSRAHGKALSNSSGDGSEFTATMNNTAMNATNLAVHNPAALSATKTADFDYVDTKDIRPLKNPSGEFNKAVKALEIQEWPELFTTLNIIRAAMLHHSNMVMQSGLLHSIVLLIVKQVDNLRSSLAKNAIITITDAFIGLGKNIDMEVASILPSLLKRSADSSNNFLSEVSDRALEHMIEHISVNRSLSSFVTMIENTKSVAQRAKATYFLYYLTKLKAKEFNNFPKEFDAFKNKLHKLLQDSSPETRLITRNIIKELILNNIVRSDELENYRLLPDQIDKCLQEKNSPTANASSSNGIFTPKTSQNSAGFRALMNEGAGDIDWNLTAEDYSESSYQSRGSNAARNQNSKPSPMKGRTALLRTPPRSAANEDGATPQRSNRIRARSPRNGDHSSSNVDGGIANTPSRASSFNSQHLHVDSTEYSLSPDDDEWSREPLSPVARRLHSSNQPISSTPQKVPRSPRAGTRGTSTPATATAAKRMMESDPQLMQWQHLVMTISTSKNWNEKKEALSTLTNCIIKHCTILKDVGKLESSLDCILDRFADGSLKIIVHAMDCWENILANNESVLLYCNILQFIIPKFFPVISNTNRQVNQRGFVLIKNLLKNLSPIQVSQYLVHVSEFDIEKNRIAALKLILELMNEYCQDPEILQQVVKKIIFVSACKIMFTEATKVEIRLTASDVIKSIQSHVKHEKIWKWTDAPYQQDEVKRITANIS